MAQTIKLKRSATSGAVPTTGSLELGEVAINTYDGKMYIKKNDGTESVIEIGEQYVLPFTDNSTNWNTAYSWGDHAAAGYLTSFTETDPTVPAHVKAISTTNISNWNTAYGWGDHAAAGYLPSASYTAADVLTKIKTVDGSGSGLDADLLDGYQASTVRNAANTIPVRDANGYANFGWINTTSGETTNPIAKIYGTYTGDNYVRWFSPSTLISQQGIWTSSNDGSGSGLDADLLDGQQGSYYRPVADSLYYKPTRETAPYLDLNAATTPGIYRLSSVANHNGHPTGSGYGFNIVLDNSDVHGHILLDRLNGGTMHIRAKTGTTWTTSEWNKVWTSGNDGSGSGLDADLLDGQQGSYYYSPSNSTELLNFGSDITSQDWNTYIDGTEASYNCVLNMSGANRPTAYGYGIAVNFGKSGQAGLQIYAPESGTNSNGIYVRTKWNTGYRPWRSLAMHGINPQTGGSLYADTFYDSNNTSYYVNPASTSVLNSVRLSTLQFSDTSPTLQEDGNYLRIQTASGWTSIGSGNSSWTHFFTDRGGFYFGTKVNVNGEIRVYNTSSVLTSTGAYAPAFYDSDNTGYYVNPLNTSVMNVVTIGGSGGGYISRNPGSQLGSMWIAAGSNGTGGGNTVVLAGGNVPYVMADQSGTSITGDLTPSGTLYLDNPNNSSTTDPNIDSKGELTSGTAYSYHALFKDGNGVIKGRITHNQYGAQFSNLSDYRAKEDYQEVENATSRLMSIPVRNFQWIGSDLRTDGFLAHEIAEVVPEAVVGEKDAVLEDGTPDYQSIDQSKIVPLLVKTIQELEARITALENA